MAILSILRLISYSFNTNFLLVNFAIIKKKTKKKKQRGGERRPLSPPNPFLDPPMQIHEHLPIVHASSNLGSTSLMNLFSSSFWIWYQAIFVLLLKKHVFVTSSSEDENIIK